MDALLSLGGNVGDRRANMEAALAAIAALPGTKVLADSPCYRTAPDGPIAQDWFVNLAVAVRTTLDADALAAACREIEAGLGRDRSVEIPWGPRTVDIDVIATGSAEEMEPFGAKLDTRAFVVIPMADIASEVRVSGLTLGEWARRADRSGIEELDWQLAPP
jgi:2-amino-4-hydroxy-6-hydroxymethyldihydropteridine diphosphokinase